jgi:hypothetical protein
VVSPGHWPFFVEEAARRPVALPGAPRLVHRCWLRSVAMKPRDCRVAVELFRAYVAAGKEVRYGHCDLRLGCHAP